jgi:hypothetical protein
MSLPKIALTAVFLCSVCSPAWAETTVDKPSAHVNSTVTKVENSPLVSVPQNTIYGRGVVNQSSQVSTPQNSRDVRGQGEILQQYEIQTCGMEDHTSKISTMRRR